MARKQQRQAETEEIVGPARRHALHVEREVRTPSGMRKAWRNVGEHPLTYIFEKGQLARGAPQHTPQDRYDAGCVYRHLCEVLLRSGKDSTEMALVDAHSHGQIGQGKIDAIRKLAAIDARMKTIDRRILRRVCGDAWWPSEAVREACGHNFYVNAAMPRFVEALDALVEAMRSIRGGV